MCVCVCIWRVSQSSNNVDILGGVWCQRLHSLWHSCYCTWLWTPSQYDMFLPQKAVMVAAREALLLQLSQSQEACEHLKEQLEALRRHSLSLQDSCTRLQTLNTQLQVTNSPIESMIIAETKFKFKQIEKFWSLDPCNEYGHHIFCFIPYTQKHAHTHRWNKPVMALKVVF